MHLRRETQAQYPKEEDSRRLVTLVHVPRLHYSCANLESKRIEVGRLVDMSKRYFVAVYTDSGCLCACEHKHQNVTTAAACISQPGGYVVAVRRQQYLPLTEAEQAEFESAMYGRQEPSEAPAIPLLVGGVKVQG